MLLFGISLAIVTANLATAAVVPVPSILPPIPTQVPNVPSWRPDYNDTDLSQVHFLLYTRTNPSDYYEVMMDDIPNLIESPFDDKRRTYFLFHGWGGNAFNGYLIETRELLLKWSNCQVFTVDYEDATHSANYDKAVFNIFEVAEFAASFIDYIMETTSMTTDQIHIIGHSLGAQTGGLTAQYVKGGLIDRVTGLDPAGPLFYTADPEDRLDPSDAGFVDIIHSNGCRIDHMCYGEFAPVGHVDFYPNGGRHQAGCIAATDFLTGCSHGRSHDYWIESLKAPFDTEYQKQFWSYKCDDYAAFNNGTCQINSEEINIMGFRANRKLTGSFFLNTHRLSPFAEGKLI